MARLFISHSSGDNAAALALRDWLAGEGWDDVFLDLDPERGIVSGERWERALHQAAQRCEAVLFLISRHWLGSDWCAREFDLASRLGKRLIGVVVDATPVADIPPRYTDTWQLTSLGTGADGQVFAARLPPDGVEAYVVFSRDGLRRLRDGLQRAGLDPRHFDWPPADDPGRPAYRGLLPLEAADAGIFFGRDAALIGALDQIRQLRERAPPRLLVILGASGAGKSSFLRAGLLPRLGRDDRNFLPLQPIRPERAVLDGEHGLVAALHAALARLGRPRPRPEIATAVRSGEGLCALLEALARAAPVPTLPDEAPAPPPAIVLAVDQAEELFLAEGAAEARLFLDALAVAAASGTVRVLVLFTIRTDLYAPLQSAKALEGLQQELFSLPPMPIGAYREVIEGPARRLGGLRVSPALGESLAAVAARGGGDALPLLAFTLEKLWHDPGATGVLAPEGYDAAVGFEDAMAAAVERAMDAAVRAGVAPAEETARLALLRRGLIPWLAGIDPVTKAPRRRRAKRSEIPAEALGLVNHLVEARLLATDTEDEERVVEPAHEALLRRWGVLRGWLEEDLALLVALEGVLEATRDWEANARDTAWLAHRAGRLVDADGLRGREDLWARLGRAGGEYLATCRREEEERRDRELSAAKELAAQQAARAEAEARGKRRATKWLTLAMVALSMAAGAAGFGWWQRDVAKREAEAAAEARQDADDRRAQAERALAVARGALTDMVGTMGRPQHFGALGAGPMQQDLVNALAPRFAEVMGLANDAATARAEADAQFILGRLALRNGNLATAMAILGPALEGAERYRAAGGPDPTLNLHVVRSGALLAEALRRSGDQRAASDVLNRAARYLPNEQTPLTELAVPQLDALSWYLGEWLEQQVWTQENRFQRVVAERGVAVANALLATAPENAEYLDGASAAHRQLALSLRRNQETYAAYEMFERSSGLAEEAYRRVPRSFIMIRRLIRSQMDVADAVQDVATENGVIREDGTMLIPRRPFIDMVQDSIRLIFSALDAVPDSPDLHRWLLYLRDKAAVAFNEAWQHRRALSESLAGVRNVVFALNQGVSLDEAQTDVLNLAGRMAFSVNRMRIARMPDGWENWAGSLEMGRACENAATALGQAPGNVRNSLHGRALIIALVGCALRAYEKPGPGLATLGVWQPALGATRRDLSDMIGPLIQRFAPYLETIPSTMSELPRGYIALREVMAELLSLHRERVVAGGDTALAARLLNAEVAMLADTSNGMPANIIIGDLYAEALRARAAWRRSSGDIRGADADVALCADPDQVLYPSSLCIGELRASLADSNAGSPQVAELTRRLANYRRETVSIDVTDRPIVPGGTVAEVLVPVARPPRGYEGVDHVAQWYLDSRGIRLDPEEVGRLRRIEQEERSREGTFSLRVQQAAPSQQGATSLQQPASAQRTFLIFFDFGRAELTARARELLDSHADALIRSNAQRVEISSHLDTAEDAAGGLRRWGTTSDRLSRERGTAVANYLAQRGVPRSVMILYSHQAQRLLVRTDPGVREPQNRRVEIYVR